MTVRLKKVPTRAPQKGAPGSSDSKDVFFFHGGELLDLEGMFFFEFPSIFSMINSILGSEQKVTWYNVSLRYTKTIGGKAKPALN